ncbi:MAG: HigA family addiction module antitoxin [Cyclobacteriaceae bacterium]
MEKLPNIHPGEVLSEEFLKPMGITAYKLSKAIRVPQTRISEILKKNRRITADTALRLSQYFSTTPKFWLGLQDDYDIEEESNSKSEEFAAIENITTSQQTI